MRKLYSRFPVYFVVRALMCVILAGAATIAVGQAGHLDPTFGTNGIFSDTFNNGGGRVFATVVALQSDGKIIVGGENVNFGTVIRLNTNGTLDTGFGTNGLVNLKFRVIDNVVAGLAIQPNGQIVVCGNGIPGGGALYRLNSDGSVDTTFGRGGSVFIFPGNPGALVLQPDGRIVVETSGSGEATEMQRFESNGQLDSSFGSVGSAPLFSFGALVLQSDSTFLVGSNPIAKYNSNGSVVAGFGILGQAGVLPSVGGPLAVQSNGRIVTAGSITTSLSLNGNRGGFGLARLVSGGVPDLTFGIDGGVATNFPGVPQASVASVAIQSNGNLVAAGTAGTSTTGSFALARYLPNTGQLDSTFGTGGLVTTNFGNNTNAAISSIVLQTDGKIVAVGNVNGANYTVARYLVQ